MNFGHNLYPDHTSNRGRVLLAAAMATAALALALALCSALTVEPGFADAASEAADAGAVAETPLQQVAVPQAVQAVQADQAERTVLGKPSSLKVSRKSAMSFHVSWSPVPGAEKYQVQVRVTSPKAAATRWFSVKETPLASALVCRTAKGAVPPKARVSVRVRAVAGQPGTWSKVLVVATPKAKPADRVYSHRGTAQVRIAHTYAAYDWAIKHGSKFIEQDLVLSKDGTLYVSHDKWVRTTSGKKLYFKNMTDERIGQLRKLNGERIHTLQQVYDRYGDKVTYLVEMKQAKREIAALARFVDANHPKSIVVQTWSAANIEKLHKAIPGAQLLFLVKKKAALKQALRCKDADIVCMSKNLLTKSRVDAIHRAGKVASAFTLNTEKQIRKGIRAGLDTYFTDFTDRAMAAEKKYRKK